MTEISPPISKLSTSAIALGTMATPEILLILPEVCKSTSLGKSWIYDAVQRGEFPKPVHLTPRRVAWRESEIESWKAAKIAARDAG